MRSDCLIKALLVFTAFTCSLWADIKVEKVAEIKSIKEYNQWIKSNNITEQELSRIKIKSEKIVHGDEYRILYYNADGYVFMEETLNAKPNIWLGVSVFNNVGHLVTIESPRSHEAEGTDVTVTAKDSEGNITCSFTGSGAGLFIVPSIGFFNNNINHELVEVINWDGDIIGEFPSTGDLFDFGIVEYVTSPNEEYVLINFVMGPGYVALWKEDVGIYRLLWQKSFSSAVKISISQSGQYSCIGDGGYVYVYDCAGNLSYSYCFSQHGLTNPFSDFSPDGNYLVCALSSHMALIDNQTGKLMWEIPVDGDAFVRQVLFMETGEYIILTHFSAEKAYIYDLKGDLQATLDNVYGCSLVDDMIICGSKKDEFHKTVYRVGKD